MVHTACCVPVTQTRDGSNFRKTTATFQPGAKTLPQRYFVSPEIFAEELQKIFATNWVLVGHQSQVAEAGDYFLAEVAGESLIVTKDQRSTIRAFYNVCRHRAARTLGRFYFPESRPESVRGFTGEMV